MEYYPGGVDEGKMPQRRPQTILKNLLKNACADGYRFVFLIDEFELLTRDLKLQEDRYLHYLRGISDNYALAFVTSTRKPLTELTIKADIDGSPFDNNFSHPLELGLLDENECEQLIDGILENHGYRHEFSDECVNEAIELAGRHPYFVKLACTHLFEWANSACPCDVDWKKKFKVEAYGEFDRMWEALEAAERHLVIAISKRDNADIANSKEIESLVKRGMLIRNKDDKLVLFSQALVGYINDYVGKIESNYEQIERDIREHNVELNSDNELMCQITQLIKLKNEWHEQQKSHYSGLDSSSTDNDFEKCTVLLSILRHYQDLLKVGSDLTTIEAHAKNTVCSIKLEKALRLLSEDFSRYGWFEADDKASIGFYTGKSILDQIIQYLETIKRHHMFGNGYDQLLATRIAFMQHFDMDNFKTFGAEVEHAFNRLVEVFDYSRATKVLGLKLPKVLQWVLVRFLSSPIPTTLAMIVVPIMLLQFVSNKISGELWGIVVITQTDRFYAARSFSRRRITGSS